MKAKSKMYKHILPLMSFFLFHLNGKTRIKGKLTSNRMECSILWSEKEAYRYTRKGILTFFSIHYKYAIHALHHYLNCLIASFKLFFSGGSLIMSLVYACRFFYMKVEPCLSVSIPYVLWMNHLGPGSMIYSIWLARLNLDSCLSRQISRAQTVS